MATIEERAEERAERAAGPGEPAPTAATSVDIHALLRSYIDAGHAAGLAEANAGEHVDDDPDVGRAWETCARLRTEIGLYVVGLEETIDRQAAALRTLQSTDRRLRDALAQVTDDLIAERERRTAAQEAITEHYVPALNHVRAELAAGRDDAARLREAIRKAAADPDVPMCDSVADAVELANAGIDIDPERLARIRERVLDAARQALSGEGRSDA